MKIAIVGAGAMVSVYAAILGDAGNEVAAVDTWADGAGSNPGEVGVCNPVMIATKAVDVEAAAAVLKPQGAGERDRDGPRQGEGPGL